MTAKLPFTQAQVCRAILAAEKAGLRVVGIKPDGTVMVDNESKSDQPSAEPSKWEDAEA